MLRDPGNLRSVLRTLAELVADEADSNPSFAAALGRVLGVPPSPANTETGAAVQKTEALPDPFDVYQAVGLEGLQACLAELTVQQLQSIVRQHRFDPSRLTDKWKRKDRFIDMILDRVESRSKQGEAFRHYGTRTGGTDRSDHGIEAP